MLLAAAGMLALLVLHSDIADFVFRFMWISAACIYLYSMLYAVQLDPRTGRHSWREAIMFPGLGALLLMAIALFPWHSNPVSRPSDWISPTRRASSGP